MADISITEPWSKDPIPETKPSPANIYGMDVNYAAGNAWYGFLAIESILGSKYKNLNLHLTRFSLPQQQMQSTTVNFRGVEKLIPTKVLNPSDKTLTIEYIIDEKWENYKAIHAWMSGIRGSINRSIDCENTGIQPTDYLPFRIYLLDNFKRKVVEFCFENTWV